MIKNRFHVFLFNLYLLKVLSLICNTKSQFILSGLVYKPHPRFLAQNLSKKVQLIHESLRYWPQTISTSCVEEQEQNQSHSKSGERDGNGLVMCCACHQQHYHELPLGGPLMAAGRETDQNKHGGRQWRKRWKRTAGHGVTLNDVHSDRGLMCFWTRRGLSKYSGNKVS